MPYLHSQYTPETDRPTSSWAASSSEQVMEAGLSPDVLTGLPSLAEFYGVAGPRVTQCLSAGEACAIAIFDVDHYRRLTETYCEETGQSAIRRLAGTFKVAAAGTRHVVARLGEQVFGMLLVGLDAEASTDFCETLRAAISEMPISTGDLDIHVTVSVGVAEIYGPETFDNYLNAAEQFLFMSKSYGRNRVFSDHTITLDMAA